MELLGIPIETIYLYTLIISGMIIVLYVFFGDIAEGMSEGDRVLNPTLILAFLTFMGAIGYLLEVFTELNSYLILVIAAFGSLILDILLNVFILTPLANAEESLVYTEDSLKGRLGHVIIPIPKDGYGEVIIESISGRISKPAASFENVPVEDGVQVLVIDVKDGIIYVVPHHSY